MDFMEFTPLRGKIIDMIASRPEGASFNKLADKLRGELSRIVLSREIKNMSLKGFLKISRDPKHKQRKIITVGNPIAGILNRIGERNWDGKISMKEAFEIILRYIIEYRRLVKNVSNPFLRDYIKYRILNHLEKVLESVAE
ncbi:MAG: hypothetical protein FGF52_03315 [Candidatus Brockarchaeota archaeon]|nr:hypothetical protein [Candidatus Brockarchaeota archaeon]